jgi:prolyl oligopeptidase
MRQLVFVGFVCGVTAVQSFNYPETQKGEVVEDYFGREIADPYRWLEDPDSPDTAAWIEAENKVTFDYLEKLPDRDPFKERLTRLQNYERYSVPFWEGDRYFIQKNDGLQNQSVLYTQASLTAEPEVLLDPNELSKDGTIALSSIDITRDGRLMAYGLATSGSDWNEIKVRDVNTRQDLPDLLRWVKFSSPSWTKDNKGFFYSRYPEPEPNGNRTFTKLRDQKLYYHRAGDQQEKDVLVYERPDQPEWFFEGDVTHDGRFVVMSVSKGTEEKHLLYFKDLGDPANPKIDAPFTPIIDQWEADVRVIGNVGDRLLMLTDLGAPRYRVVAVDLRNPPRDQWREIVPESSNLLEGGVLVGGKLVLNYLVDAKSELQVVSLEGKMEAAVPLPTLGSVAGLSGQPDRSELFFAFTSFLFPTTIYRYDVSTGKSEVFRKPRVDFDPGRFETRQVFYRSKDGTRVPMFLVCQKGLDLNSTNPVLLTAYGGFNISLKPGFSVSSIAWIEKGGVFAQPNLRGGGEYGREWHEAGTKERKQNVFDDFTAAAEYLIKEGFTSPCHLGITGGSNGGLLVGAAMTQRPDLFGAVVPRVGVLDMLRFHKFTIGWAWAADYGTSDTAAGFDYLFKYSPLHNIRAGTCYPPTLLATADHDDRVVPGHSFKFAAALQAAQGCANPVLIRIDTKAGHGAGKPISKQLDEQADILAFLWANTAGESTGAGAVRSSTW